MRDLYVEGCLAGCKYPTTAEGFIDLAWQFVEGLDGFRLAFETMEEDRRGRSYGLLRWYESLVALKRHAEKEYASGLVPGRSVRLLHFPSRYPSGHEFTFDDLRACQGTYTRLEWEPSDLGLATMRIGGFLADPNPRLAGYLDAVRRSCLRLLATCKPALGWCGEQVEALDPALRAGREQMWFINWVNFYGLSYVQRYGRGFFMEAPGYRKEEVSTDFILYQPTKGFLPWEAQGPTPAEIEGYFRSHPAVRRLTYRPWLKNALLGGAVSPPATPRTLAPRLRRRSLIGRILGRRGRGEPVAGSELPATHATAEGLRAYAERFVEEFYEYSKLVLDYTPESLESVDEVAPGRLGSGPETWEAIIPIAAYLGEVIIRNLGGKWRSSTSWLDCAVVGALEGEVYPMRAVQDRVRGMGPSLLDWYAHNEDALNQARSSQ